MFGHVFPAEEGRGSHKRGPRSVPRVTGLPGPQGPARGPTSARPGQSGLPPPAQKSPHPKATLG